MLPIRPQFRHGPFKGDLCAVRISDLRESGAEISLRQGIGHPRTKCIMDIACARRIRLTRPHQDVMGIGRTFRPTQFLTVARGVTQIKVQTKTAVAVHIGQGFRGIHSGRENIFWHVEITTICLDQKLCHIKL